MYQITVATGRGNSPTIRTFPDQIDLVRYLLHLLRLALRSAVAFQGAAL